MAKNRKRKSRSLSGAKSIELRDDLGNFLRRVTEDELQHMLSRHAAIRRVSKTVYMEMPQVRTSESKTSPCELTLSDMNAAAILIPSGVRLTTRLRERLMGHRILADRDLVTKAERSQPRAIYFDMPTAEMAPA